MTKIGLTNRAKPNLPECAVGISARKKLIHTQEIDSHYATERGSTDYSGNSCRMRFFCHVQLFEITRAYKIKSPIQQQSCHNA
jgi:hypothetical protein